MSRARYARNSSTSKDAATHANRTLSLRQRAVLEVIIRNNGATIAEIAKELGVPNNEVSGRIAELRDDKKYIADTGIKRATVTPCRGIVFNVHPSLAHMVFKNSLHNPADVSEVRHVGTVTPAAAETCATDARHFGPLFGGAARIMIGTPTEHAWHDVEVVSLWDDKPRIEFANGSRMTVDASRLVPLDSWRFNLRRRVQDLRDAGDEVAASLAEDRYKESTD